MRWAAITLLGALLVSAWAATIPLQRTILPDARQPLARAATAAHSELMAAEGALREFARVDSLLPLLPDSPGIAVVLADSLEPGLRDSIDAALMRELAETGPPRVRLGVFMIDGRYGARTGYGGGPEREVYLGADDGGPYCAMVESTVVRGGRVTARAFGLGPERSQYRSITGAGVLGVCAFVARYGPPSPAIEAWLRAGGHEFARLRGAAVTRPQQNATDSRWPYWLQSATSLSFRACRAGRLEACRSVALDIHARRQEGPAAFDMWIGWDVPETATMLSDLEEEFGADRFARFWSGPDGVEQAFSAAFGTGMDEWMSTWSRRAGDRILLAARMDMITVLLALLTALGFAAIAAAVATRRNV